MRRLARFAWLVLAYNVMVILWGAYVRASGSGAGCGSHWPLCNGEVIPRAPSAEMLVEFSHRLTSGLALVAVAALAVWVFRAVPRGGAARSGAAWSLFFMLAEAGVGAALVLFRLVADNASLARALFMAVHLTNTFLLLASLAATAHWLSGGAPVRIRRRPGLAFAFAAAFVALLAVGTSGAVAALGDTLYPAGSLAEALRSDLSPTSHVLIRLRVLHPALAIGTALLIMAFASRMPLPEADNSGRRAARSVAVLAAAQIGAGFLNVVLLAPVWMQLAHLLLADALWIAFVLFAMSALAEQSRLSAALAKPAA